MSDAKIRMVIKRQAKPNLVMYFDAVSDVENFCDFIKELIASARKEMILDATCGLRRIWFDSKDPETVYLDVRKEINFHRKSKRYPSDKNINPDILADNQFLPFRDNVFDLVVYDPPHYISSSWKDLYDLYGVYHPLEYQKIMWGASRELFRVLKDRGSLVFKWSEVHRNVKQILELFPENSLFGQKVNALTWWVVFQKHVAVNGS